MHAHDQKIYLASKSPRRRELLRQIGVDFELLLLRDQSGRVADVTELVLPGEAAVDYVQRVTREKVDAAMQIILTRHLPLRVVLSADTTVVLDQDILGKPTSQAEASAMLHRLSGRTHQVLTSVALRSADATWQITQRSDVTFASLTAETIRAYCAGAEPYDKAGGYGIQGYAASFVTHMAGSYTGIMGLPLFETAQLLRQAGLRVP
ncbi:Maf family protein [Actimicrobium sp. CCI2.3]|uniref:Maf family protein n=1 Tax=Actimicrobium sp. CCI2.3 TaxID=3048616 RepID=UPI002AB476DC|nr:Maf family protein [Actimicrobium sp. CCI2.3]MDY7573842.1 Maf family protein [Actimicrobium sp. CCI2.3]MEB0023436.1 Maf family protein [Actimicrobium sp. CCI2.3]